MNNYNIEDEIDPYDIMAYRLTDGSYILAEEHGEDNNVFYTGVQLNILGFCPKNGIKISCYAYNEENMIELYQNNIISRFRPEEGLMNVYMQYILNEQQNEESSSDPDLDWLFKHHQNFRLN